MSCALVAETAYSFRIKVAASATAGEREMCCSGGKLDDIKAMADSDRWGGHAGAKWATAEGLRFAGGAGCSGREEDTGRDCVRSVVRAGAALDGESC